MSSYTIITSPSGNSGKVVRGGEAIQVSEGTYEAMGDKGTQIDFNGQVRTIKSFGDRFKIGKVAFRYVYLTERVSDETPEIVPCDGGQSEMRHAII